MKLSTRGQYGLHAMLDLSLYGQASPQSIKSIAERQSIPEAYLEQLIGKLKKHGLVKSVRGAQGGYMLSEEPSRISVGQILRALEGDLAVVDCITEEGHCEKAVSCPARTVFQKVHDGINGIVDGITLKDMLDDQAKKAQITGSEES